MVHFCYLRDWQFSDKPCRFNRFFGDSRNSVSGKSIWHHHRTRWYQSNRLHIWNISRDQHFRSHGSRVLAPGLPRLLHNLSFSFKDHRLVTSEAKGDETSGMYVVLSTQLKLLVLNIIYSIYLRMHKGSLDDFDLIPNMLRKY